MRKLHATYNAIMGKLAVGKVPLIPYVRQESHKGDSTPCLDGNKTLSAEARGRNKVAGKGWRRKRTPALTLLDAHRA